MRNISIKFLIIQNLNFCKGQKDVLSVWYHFKLSLIICLNIYTIGFDSCAPWGLFNVQGKANTNSALSKIRKTLLQTLKNLSLKMKYFFNKLHRFWSYNRPTFFRISGMIWIWIQNIQASDAENSKLCLTLCYRWSKWKNTLNIWLMGDKRCTGSKENTCRALSEQCVKLKKGKVFTLRKRDFKTHRIESCAFPWWSRRRCRVASSQPLHDHGHSRQEKQVIAIWQTQLCLSPSYSHWISDMKCCQTNFP